MLLAEELVLFAIDPPKGRPPLGVKERLEVASAGLLLAELVLRGHGEILDEHLWIEPDFLTSGERLLDEAAEIVRRTPAPLRKQVVTVRKDMDPLVDRLLDELAADDIIELHDERILLKHVVRVDIAEPEVYDDVVVDLRQAAQSDGQLSQGLAAILAMTGPINLLEKVAPERETRDHARERIDHAADDSAIVPGVKWLLDETDAVINSISVATTAITAAVPTSA